jgi:hypothetical protein
MISEQNTRYLALRALLLSCLYLIYIQVFMKNNGCFWLKLVHFTLNAHTNYMGIKAIPVITEKGLARLMKYHKDYVYFINL